MVYRKIMLEVVVQEADSEVLTRALNDAMGEVEEEITVFSSGIVDVETTEPENAKDVGNGDLGRS